MSDIKKEKIEITEDFKIKRTAEITSIANNGQAFKSKEDAHDFLRLEIVNLKNEINQINARIEHEKALIDTLQGRIDEIKDLIKDKEPA